MKNFYALFFSLLFFFSNTYSQIDSTYVPFPTDSVAWNESGGGVSGVGMATTYNSFIYMVGDTATINNKLYNIVYQSRYKAFDPNGNIMGYLREDNKIVYFTYGNSSPEEIYYDFNINIGDTTWYPNYGHYSVLDSVDFILIEDSTFRKRYNFSTNSFSMTLIEGIGNIEGGLLHPNIDFFFENVQTLNCVIRPNEVIYKNKDVADHNCYELGLPIKELTETDNTLYPNPFHNHINFKEKIINSSINVYTISGKNIYQEKEFNSNKLDLRTLENGIYFLEIIGKKRYYQRIIKM